MIFSSTVFLFCLLPITFLVYYVLKDSLKKYWLLAVSVFFYAWGDPKYLLFILAMVVINYSLALVIDHQKEQPRRNAVTAIAALLNLACLLYFKYSGFFSDILYRLTGLDLHDTFLVSKMLLPLGISYLVFQILSYVFDVARRKIPAEKNFLNLSFYVMFFPRIISGPILRYEDMAKEIDTRTVDADKVYSGIKRFMLGFAKKALLANALGMITDYAYGHIGTSALLSWLGAVSYMLQLYYDFSGYTDMAIGLAKMAGFTFPENFDFPYRAKGIREFWRRWHMTLSFWFRDYLYIPLGGSRKGAVRTYINTLIVFMLTGLWHGASFSFIVWGLWHGAFICMERLFLDKWLKKCPSAVSRVYTILIVMFGWIFFRAPSLSAALGYIKSMFAFNNLESGIVSAAMDSEKWLFLLVSILLVNGIPAAVKRFAEKNKVAKIATEIVFMMVFCLAVFYMIGSDSNPFIYFRF